jgi:hypothetical protein
MEAVCHKQFARKYNSHDTVLKGVFVIHSPQRMMGKQYFQFTKYFISCNLKHQIMEGVCHKEFATSCNPQHTSK